MSTETIDRGDDFTPTEDVKDDAADKAAEALEKEIEDDLKVKTEVKTEVETEETEEEKPKKKDDRIPASRHKQILDKERERREAVERELAAVKQGQQVVETNKDLTESENSLLKLEKEYNELLVDGKVAEASAKMTEIRRLERSVIETKASFATQAAEARAYDRVQYDMTVSRLEEAYPALNPDHADFDKEQTTEVVELRDGFIATGRYTRAQAIQKAVKMVMGVNTTRQERAAETEARVTKEDLAQKVAEERTIAARKKAGEAAGKQPASMARVGLDSDKMGGGLTAAAVMKMSQDQFAKLDETALARLRGDEI